MNRGIVALAVAMAAVPLVTVDAPAAAAATATVSCTAPPGTEPAPSAPLTSYQAINPQRLVDTRDGTGGVASPVGKGCTLLLDLSDSAVPGSASAVALSLTALADIRGFFTAYPCAAGRPPTSNLNSRAGIATPNLVVVPLDSARRVCVFSNQRADVIVDLAGWWSDGPNRLSTIRPVRAYDTRTLPGGARLPAGAIRNIPIGGPFVPADATAAVVNLTATDATRRGNVLAFPCGNPAPLASNLNFVAGESRAVAAIVGLGAGGQLCVRANVDTHVVVDVTGYYAPAPAFGPAASLQPVASARLADSRDGTGGWSTRFGVGEERALDPVASTALADRATAVLLNVTATNGSRTGNLRVYPCGEEVPTSSTLNFSAEGSVANLALVDLSASRRICVFASQATDVIVDLFGVAAVPDGVLAERLDLAGASQPISVWPPFENDAEDYVIECGGGPLALTLTVDLVPFAALRVNGVAVSPGVLDVRLAAEQLLSVELSRGGELRRYHFRCPPADFPQLVVDRPGEPAPGWYLTTFGQGSSSPSAPYVVILDERGVPVWYKRSERVLVDAQRLASGNISASTQGQFFGTTGDALARRVITLNGSIVAEWRTDDPVTFPVDHHDFAELPGGGRVFVSYPLRQNVDLTPLGPGFFANDSVVDSALRELDAAGNLVWSWRSNDHFGVEETTYPQRFGRYPGEPNGGEVNIFHMNSFGLAGDGSGDYVASARHLDAVFRIDRASGDVEWILGGSGPNLGGAPRLTIVGDALGGPRRPHDARLDGDVLTLFDNRTEMSGQPARAVAYRIDTANADPAAWTATLEWEIRDVLGRNSPALGSTRVGEDGSVLIGWGFLQPMFEEVAASGERLLAVSQLPFGNSYRIVKYPPSAFDAARLRATAGGSIPEPL